MHPRDAFLLAYLPYGVGTHFLTLQVLEAAQASGAAEAVVKAELAALPLRGPEVVSCVWEVENVLAAAGATPPAPPRTLEGHAAWSQAVVDALRALADPRKVEATSESAMAASRVTAAMFAGRALGDTEQTLRLRALVDRMLAASPGHPALVAQDQQLARAHAEAPKRFESLTSGLSIAQFLGPYAVDALARAEAAVAGADRAQALGVVADAARTVERCMLAERARSTLARVHAGQVALDTALEQLFYAPGFQVAVELPIESTPLARVDRGAMRVFTDGEAVVAGGQVGEAMIVSKAWSILGQVDPRVQELAVDPGSPHALVIPREALGRLQHRCLSARVAAAATDWSGVDRATLRGFAEYRVLVDDTRYHHAHAPDARGRKLVAVFTSDAAAQAYFARVAPPAGARIGWLDGARLFGVLRGVEGVGIVFDPCGPGRPRVFPRAFVDQLATA